MRTLPHFGSLSLSLSLLHSHFGGGFSRFDRRCSTNFGGGLCATVFDLTERLAETATHSAGNWHTYIYEHTLLLCICTCATEEEKQK